MTSFASDGNRNSLLCVVGWNIPCAFQTCWASSREGQDQAGEDDLGLETLQCEQKLRKPFYIKNNLKKIYLEGSKKKPVFKFLKKIGKKIKLWYSQIIKVKPKFRGESYSFWWIAFFRRQRENRALSWDTVEGPPASAGPVVPSSLLLFCDLIKFHAVWI